MSEQKNWKILQIIPAQPGWKAVHCEESANGEMKISNRSIICWALVEPVGESVVGGTEVRGVEQGAKDLAIVGTLIKAKDSPSRNQYFLGYDDPAAHKESEYWVLLGNQRLRRNEKH